jgi:hypothetical protein
MSTPTPNSDLHKMVAEMFLQMKQLTSEVSQLRSLVEGSPVHIEGWAAPDKAASALQADGVKNARHLQRLRLEGVFSDSKGEIRNVSKGDRPTWEYHIPNCRKALQRYFKRQAG